MKKIILVAFFFVYAALSAQSNTDIFLVDITETNGKTQFQNPRNISNNKGYDNQPSFYNDATILFSSTRDGQTDIAQYDLNKKETSWITTTKSGSEYSPLKIPNTTEVSAVRLDTTGLQRLYKYKLQDGTSELLLKDQKVGYYVWYNKDILITSVLVDERMDLVISNLKEKTIDTVHKNIGRSLHKIPNSNLISFFNNTDQAWAIKTLDPTTKNIKELKTLPYQINDMCWLADGTLLVPDGKMLAKYNPKIDTDWSILHLFEEKEINEISRMAVSPDGKHLALVVEESPEIIIQKQVDFFNQRDLNGFASCFSDKVVVKNFPQDTISVGNSELVTGYKKFFANNPNTNVEVVKRMIVGSKVIDEERVTVNGKMHRQAAIYEVKNGKIQSMTFIHEKNNYPEAEAIVQKQVDAYNARDIEGFVDTFSDAITAYHYPNKFDFEGKEALRKQFSLFFEKNPDLHTKIKNRIVLENFVIDDEEVTASGKRFNAIVIYKVLDGKIAKMTFLR